MHKAIIVILTILCCGGFALWDMMAKPVGKPSSPTLRYASDLAVAPEMSFKDIHGKTHIITKDKAVGNAQKVIILNFWATWCAPCIKEIPQLFQLATREKDNITLIMMSVDKNVDTIAPFFKNLGLNNHQDNIIIGHDPDKTISKDGFGTTMYPETFIIALDMTIKAKITGIVDWLGDDVHTLIHN